MKTKLDARRKTTKLAHNTWKFSYEKFLVTSSELSIQSKLSTIILLLP